MWDLTIRNLLEHKRRVVLTAVAVLLGVAFMGATQILGATVNRSLTSSAGLFYEQIHAEVRGVSSGEIIGLGETRAPVSLDVAASIEAVSGVDRVIPTYLEPVTLVQSNGKVASFPISTGIWFDDPVQPLTVAEGRAPASSDEIAMTRAIADESGLGIGDLVRFESAVGPAEATVTGIVDVESSSVAGVPSMVLGPDSGDVLLPEGQARSLIVMGHSLSLDDLNAAADAAGGAVDIRTGEAAAEKAVDDASVAATALTAAFSAFGALALFVGVFIIYNTFNILMAQRRREMALLRAIGVRRKQVVRSVLIEAAAIGLVAGVLGAALGVLIAVAGRSVLLGDIDGSLVISPTGLVTGVLIGVSTTTWSAWSPARRAAKVAPVEALREASTGGNPMSRWRLIGGVVLAALTAMLVVAGLSPETDSRATVVGMGAFVGLVALIVLSPMLATLLVPVFGMPVRWVKGQVGRLATENARRQPQRTAATATALLVGVAIVGFALVIAASLKASVETVNENRLDAELVVAPVTFGTSLTPAAVSAVDDAVGDAPTSLLWNVSAEIDESSTVLSAVDTSTAAELWDFEIEAGSASDIGPDGMIVDHRVADQEGWGIGDEVSVTFAVGGPTTFSIAGIGDTRAFGFDYIIDQADVTALDPTATAIQLLVGPGVDRTGLEAALSGFPNAQVQAPSEMSGEITSAIDLLLRVLFGFLGLSVIIAFIGVTNTLALSIHERTRELGILRAIALRRSHVRSAVRWEAAIIAALGTTLGIAYGAGFGVVLAKVLADTGFARVDVPWLQLMVVVVGAALAGALAAALPARRAAKLDVLDAIHQL